jgi:anti-sigma factor RsiW
MAPDCPLNSECSLTEDDLNALVDDQLSGRDQRRVAAHVACCRTCSELVGSTLASKRLLAARGQELEPPAESWQDLVGALDDTDRVARSASQPRRWHNLGSAPALAIAGIALVALALVWTSRMNGPGGQGQVFVKAHLAVAAMTATWPSSPGVAHDVVTPTPGGAVWQGLSRSFMPVGGEFVEHTLYRVDRTPISEFVLSSRCFDRAGLRPVHYEDGARYLVRAEQYGSVVAWEDRGTIRVLVGRVGADELLSLASSRRLRVPAMRGM